MQPHSCATCRRRGVIIRLRLLSSRVSNHAEPSQPLLSSPSGSGPTHRLLPMATATSLGPPPRVVSTYEPTFSLVSPLRPSPPRLRFGPATTAASASLCRPLPSFRCRSAAGPSPPSSEPPPPSSHGWQESVSKLQDRVRIFFAVLFWMSLFFWGSAWDGPNNSGGKKRQRFRKKQK